ncbi:integrin alpha-5 [Trichonephila clavipes]|nr:integrin alpha-5 [Trichonephila clavipes]
MGENRLKLSTSDITYKSLFSGYSIAIGEFTGDKNPDVVVGVPRGHRLAGKISLFNSTLFSLHNISGEQLGSYFGYSVCVTDINGDRLDDIIIGAPLYTDLSAKDKSYEKGRIYVAYQTRKLLAVSVTIVNRVEKMSQRRRLPNSLRWRAVGWMEMGLSQADVARRLNVSRSVVQRLWDQYQSEDSVSRRPVPGRPRATTPAEDRFLALSARRRRTTTVPQLVADHFQASGRRISATTVRNRLHNAGLYARRPVVCVPLNGRQRRNRLCWAREHVSWTQQQWASVLFTDESRFTMESDSGRLLIWREQRTRYHQSNTVERHSYRGGGILVWAGISLGGHTDLHVFHGGTVTGLRYRDEILDPYVRPYAAAIGNDFILMDDNGRPHRARIIEGVSGGSRFGTNGMARSISRPESDRTSLGLSWQRGCCFKSSSRSLHELKQGLLCVGLRFLFRCPTT